VDPEISPFHAAFLLLRLLLILIVLGIVRPAAASDVWLVSTRAEPHCGNLDESLEGLCYQRWENDCEWSPSDAKAFQSTSDTATPTVVFVPGNRTDAGWAITKGLYTYDSIRACAGDRPFRYVIWSWPADRVCRRTKADTQLKADYSDAEGYYLAQWLNQLPPGVKVSLIGHSFGPRIITGALHLLAGGEVAGRRLPSDIIAAWSKGKRNPVRAVLLAAAVDADWLAPNGCHGSALPLVEAMLITRNGCDRVLRFYPRIYGRGGPEALGSIGPCGIGDAGNVEVIDVACEVGKVHDWRDYCLAPDVCCRWSQYTFLEDLPTSDPP
jgi:hypothetical protein